MTDVRARKLEYFLSFKILFDEGILVHQLEDDAFLLHLGVIPAQIKPIRRIAKQANKLIT